jgi:hypothetical protein
MTGSFQVDFAFFVDAAAEPERLLDRPAVHPGDVAFFRRVFDERAPGLRLAFQYALPQGLMQDDFSDRGIYARTVPESKGTCGKNPPLYLSVGWQASTPLLERIRRSG